MNAHVDPPPLVQVRRDCGVTTVTLHRPEALNALTPEMTGQLRVVLQEAAGDPRVGAVVLTGAGRAFCAGADLRSGERFGGAGTDPTFEDWSDNLRAAMECSRLLHQMSKPTIAMLRGAVTGAGLGLAAACDLRIASSTAAFSTSFAKVGLSGDFGVTYFLTRIVGTARARELMYLGDRIDAAAALACGLVNRVVPDDELESATAALASRLGNGARLALRYIKRNLNAAEEGSLERVFELEAEHMARTVATCDSREAVRAFLEKRPPRFEGR